VIIMEPSKIRYWKNGEWRTTRKIFTSEEEVNEWYRRNRSRIDGLSVVIPIKQLKQAECNLSDFV